jgi:outer membrane protein assembly factor BamB
VNVGTVNRVALGLLAFCVQTACPPPCAAAASDIAAAYQINPAHSGNITLSTGFTMPLKQAWTRNDLGPMSYALIANGRIFVIGTGDPHQLYALSLSTGKTLWSRPLAAQYELGHTYDGGRVFVLGTDGIVHAFAAKDGALLWSLALNTDFYIYNAIPTAAQGQLLISASGRSNDGAIVSIDEKNGREQWAQPVLNGDDSSPAFGPDGIYVTYPCQYYKFALSGDADWHDDTGCYGGGGFTPAYYNNRVFVLDPPNSSNNVILKAKTGQFEGNFGYLNYNGAPAFLTVGKRDYGVSVGFGTLSRWSVPGGRVNWTFEGRNLSSSPIVVNGCIVVGSDTGEVYVLDSDGQLLWNAVAGGGTSIASLSAGQGTLIAISTYTTQTNAAITAFVPT